MHSRYPSLSYAFLRGVSCADRGGYRAAPLLLSQVSRNTTARMGSDQIAGHQPSLFLRGSWTVQLHLVYSGDAVDQLQRRVALRHPLLHASFTPGATRNGLGLLAYACNPGCTLGASPIGCELKMTPCLPFPAVVLGRTVSWGSASSGRFARKERSTAHHS